MATRGQTGEALHNIGAPFTRTMMWMSFPKAVQWDNHEYDHFLHVYTFQFT